MRKVLIAVMISLLPACSAAAPHKQHASVNPPAKKIAAATSSSCAGKEETQAFDLRALNSSLMVAALSCNQQKEYNHLLKKYNSVFSSSGSNIKAYFKRTYGGDSEQQLNRFVTHLANSASQGSMSGNPEVYCDETRKIFTKLNSLKQDKLIEFADQHSYSSMHGIKSCRG